MAVQAGPRTTRRPISEEERLPIRPKESGRARQRAAAADAGEPRAAEDLLYVQSVEKAFRVLAAFSRGQRTMGLAEVAAATELDRSATQRFTHTLERLGYLRKDPRTRRYELTVRTLDLGAAYLRSSTLVERALPYLMELSRATEEAVSLTVLDGAEIVYVARLLSRNSLHANLIVGSRLPAFCTAPGLAMLSRLPREEAARIVEGSDLRPFTPYTTTRAEAVLKKLEATRKRGYVVTSEELFINDISVAAPVLGPAGEPIAAVNIAVSKLRCGVADAESRYAPLVTGAASAMSHALPMDRSA